MARFTPPVAFLVALLVASAPSAASAQRPALAGEKARVAEAVKRDLERLATAQRTHHARTKLYATDLKDLRFTPTSGAEVAIAFGSMNAWAANASHPALSPVKCFVIISAADAPDAGTPGCDAALPIFHAATQRDSTWPRGAGCDKVATVCLRFQLHPMSRALATLLMLALQGAA